MYYYSHHKPSLSPPSTPPPYHHHTIAIINNQDVDVFAKDFLFVPIHDALHWSLAVVCFPGELGTAWEGLCRGDGGGGGGGGGGSQPSSQQQEQQQQQPAPAAALPSLDDDGVEVVGSPAAAAPQQQQGQEQQRRRPALPATLSAGKGGGKGGAAPPAAEGLVRRPCILHLDSIADSECFGRKGRPGGAGCGRVFLNRSCGLLCCVTGNMLRMRTHSTHPCLPSPLFPPSSPPLSPQQHQQTTPGGHSSQLFVGQLRAYLAHEWERKRRDGEAAVAAAVAAASAAAAGGDDADGAVAAAAAAAETVPYRWARDHPGLPPVRHPTPPGLAGALTPAAAARVHAVGVARADALPAQSNHCDCGLFLLAYLEYFCHAPPTGGLEPWLLGTSAAARAKRRAEYTGPRMSPFLGFLSADWFDASNASLLRGHLRALLQREMAEQAPDAGSAPARELRRLAAEYEARPRAYGSVYLSPAEWDAERDAIVAARAHQEELEAAARAARRDAAAARRDEARRRAGEAQQRAGEAAMRRAEAGAGAGAGAAAAAAAGARPQRKAAIANPQVLRDWPDDSDDDFELPMRRSAPPPGGESDDPDWGADEAAGARRKSAGAGARARAGRRASAAAATPLAPAAAAPAPLPAAVASDGDGDDDDPIEDPDGGGGSGVAAAAAEAAAAAAVAAFDAPPNGVDHAARYADAAIQETLRQRQQRPEPGEMLRAAAEALPSSDSGGDDDPEALPPPRRGKRAWGAAGSGGRRHSAIDLAGSDAEPRQQRRQQAEDEERQQQHDRQQQDQGQQQRRQHEQDGGHAAKRKRQKQQQPAADGETTEEVRWLLAAAEAFFALCPDLCLLCVRLASPAREHRPDPHHLSSCPPLLNIAQHIEEALGPDRGGSSGGGGGGSGGSGGDPDRAGIDALRILDKGTL